MSTRLILPIALSAALLCLAPPALGQTDVKAAARAHFDRGVEAFNSRRFGEAAEEFAAAYKLSPAFPVLYNIGQVNVALGRPVEAVEAFERYLREGTTIPAERRREVEAEIAKQLARIGEVTVRTVPQGADVRVDGRLVGKSPLPAPLRLSAGSHSIQALLAGHATQIKEIEVRGRASQELELRLDPFAAAPPVSVAPAPAAEAGRFVPPAVPTPAATSSPVAPGAPAALDAPPGREAPPGRAQRVIGYSLVGAGAVGGLAGVLVALSGADQAKEARTKLLGVGTKAVYDTHKAEYDEGKDKNQLGWTIAAVGAAAILGGAVVVATAPDRKADDLALTPMVAPGAGGLVIVGAF
jgi:hypothetical protein